MSSPIDAKEFIHSYIVCGCVRVGELATKSKLNVGDVIAEKAMSMQ